MIFRMMEDALENHHRHHHHQRWHSHAFLERCFWMDEELSGPTVPPILFILVLSVSYLISNNNLNSLCYLFMLPKLDMNNNNPCAPCVKLFISLINLGNVCI